MMLLCAFILLVLLFILPFIPGAREFIQKKDASPLFIDSEYLKDPRYFAISFRKLVLNSLGSPVTKEQFRDITLSKKETIHIVESGRFAGGAVVENVLYVIHNLNSEGGVTFNKEVYVRKNARIGASNRLQALACDGDIHLRTGTRFFRWLDAEGSITTEESCMLGVDATCGGALSLAQHCSFMKLYGFPVETTPVLLREIEEPAETAMVFDNETPERYRHDIQASSRIDRCIISDASVTIGDHAVVRGHIQTHGRLVTGAHVIIAGNVFAAEDVELGPHSRVLGTVFSQAHVVVRQGVRVGAKDRVKSVIGKKSITLESGVCIYGYVMTEGKGLVV